MRGFKLNYILMLRGVATQKHLARDNIIARKRDRRQAMRGLGKIKYWGWCVAQGYWPIWDRGQLVWVASPALLDEWIRRGEIG